MTDTLPPPGVQTMLGASGAPARVTHGDREWLVGHPTQKAKAELEELAAACAVAEVRALKGVLPPDAYAEMWKETLAGIQAKDFRTWGAGWQRVVWAPQNAHLFLLSLLREHHPGATEADARRLVESEPEQVTAALARVVPDFLELLLAGVAMTPDQRATVARTIANLAKSTPPQPPTPPTP